MLMDRLYQIMVKERLRVIHQIPKKMLSPTINKIFSHNDTFLIRKINEMSKPGNKIQMQKERSVVV